MKLKDYVKRLDDMLNQRLVGKESKLEIYRRVIADCVDELKDECGIEISTKYGIAVVVDKRVIFGGQVKLIDYCFKTRKEKTVYEFDDFDDLPVYTNYIEKVIVDVSKWFEGCDFENKEEFIESLKEMEMQDVKRAIEIKLGECLEKELNEDIMVVLDQLETLIEKKARCVDYYKSL